MNSPSTQPPDLWEPPSPESLQEMLPHYEILGILGRGGMGAVYRGRQIRLNRDVAIKVLPETLTRGVDEELKFAERFELEAQAMAKFNHPSIVSVFDFGETAEGQLYFVMEFVEGMDIHQYLRENGGSISQEYALSITAHVLDALEYAHARGIIHRDIKPANILLNTEGQVKIADFGLAKAFGDAEDSDKPALTMSNVALGTPDFVAPEALDGDAIPDHRADLYAVGVMLYQMLTGKIPRGQFPMPSEVVSELDPRVDEIVQQAMQFNPGDRFPSASSMRIALDPVISAPISRLQTIQKESATSTPRKSENPESAHSQPRRKTFLSGRTYMIATVLILIGAASFFLARTGPEPTPPLTQQSSPISEIPVATDQPVLRAEKEASKVDDRLDPSVEDEKEATGEAAHLAAASPPSPPDPVEPADDPTDATVDSPYENSLGMRFVPVPITGGPSDGKLILFSIWETRVQDVRPFLAENPEITLREASFPQEDMYPAVGINYFHAVAFCEWLTQSEMAKGNLAPGQHYRLPTDHEWSCAIGIGELEDPDATPASKDKALAELWPWGNTWPPPNGTINCYGEENAGLELNGKPKDHLRNYEDEYRFTAPVDSMGPGLFGLYHMSGNIHEWTSDWSDESQTRRTIRSAAWTNVPAGFFLSSARSLPAPVANGDTVGLRAVLDLNREAPETNALDITGTGMPSDAPGSGAMSPNIPETGPAATVGVMADDAPVSPLASVPGLEPRLTAYLQFRQKLIGELSEKYLGALQGRFEAAIASGDLALAKAFESEKTAVETLRSSLVALNRDPFASISSSSTLDPLPEGTPVGLSELRAVWISEREKISAQLSTTLIQSLQALEVELTKAADLENATKVKELKDAIGRQPAAPPQPSETASPHPPSIDAPSTKTFENSLGMKFVPVEVEGKEVLFSVYETTVENYRKFIREDRNRIWPEPQYRLRDRQAATLMTWADAEAFCEWLTAEERRRKVIGESDIYTLPTLLELQTAAGVVPSHDHSTGRISYSRKYLWGDEWPIPNVVGNLYGEENLEESNRTKTPISGYHDGATHTAEVGSYAPNEFGLHDVIGNVAEFCSDWFNDDKVSKAVFGASWAVNEERTLRAGFRSAAEQVSRFSNSGFRVVLRRAPES